jgi:hypothetical protein
MINLQLFDRPILGAQHKVNLFGLHEGWRRKKRAIGGYHTARIGACWS